MMKTEKVGILSLGCPRNLVDSEHILGRLHLKGYPVVELESADVGIINTCAFIEDAKIESIEAILDLVELKKEGRLKKIIVYGCLSERYKDRLRAELPEVDAFVGRISLNHSPTRFPLTAKHYAYLKICEGCINNCSFCIIPRIKGKFCSLPFDSVLDEAVKLNSSGVSEINIVGQDITAFGIDLYGKTRLSELLKGISRKSGNVGWIRLLYMHPSRISEELLYIIKHEPKICKYIDLPIQHVNKRILKMMNRNNTRKQTEATIKKIRRIIPDAAIRTSIIVGFPSETDKEFKELLEFIRDIKFERLGAFIYSREEGTAAYGFKKTVPHATQVERFNEVMSSQQGVSQEINKKFIAKTIEVLIEEENNGAYLGRSQYDAPEVDGLVYVHCAHKLAPGEFVKAKITDTLEYDLVGEVI